VPPERVLDPAQLRTLATRFRELTWSWRADELDAVLEHLGWTKKLAIEDLVMVDPNLGEKRASGSVSLTGELVDVLSVQVSDWVDQDDPTAAAAARDGFAAAVQAVTEVLGAPAKRRPGAEPQVRWTADDGVVRIDLVNDTVFWSAYRGAYAAELDREAAREQGR
jgi:hypothetical protein